MQTTKCGKFLVSDNAIYRVTGRRLKLYEGTAVALKENITIELRRENTAGYALGYGSAVIARANNCLAIAMFQENYACKISGYDAKVIATDDATIFDNILAAEVDFL